MAFLEAFLIAVRRLQLSTHLASEFGDQSCLIDGAAALQLGRVSVKAGKCIRSRKWPSYSLTRPDLRLPLLHPRPW